MKHYKFTVLIEQDEDGMYIAEVPALKGCHTQATTLEEIYPRIREAIELYIETMGDKIEIAQNNLIGIQQLEIAI